MGRVRSKYGIGLGAQSEEMEGPTHTLVLAQHMDENSRRKDEDADSLRSLKSKRFWGSVEQATCTRRQNIEEDSIDVQAKKKGNVQIK